MAAEVAEHAAVVSAAAAEHGCWVVVDFALEMLMVEL